MAIHFLNNLNRDDFIKNVEFLYRCVPINRLLELLKTKRLVFASPIKWNDPFEKLFFTSKYVLNGNEITLPIQPQNKIYKVFCLCWTVTSESEAFWTTHTPNNDGIRIKVITRGLIESLENSSSFDVYFGKVQYKQFDFITSYCNDRNILEGLATTTIKPNHLKLLLLKRKAYEYETEHRIILIPKNKIKKSIYRVQIENITNLIVDYRIDPRLGELHSDMIKDYISEKFNINRDIIKKSRLYDKINKTYNV